MNFVTFCHWWHNHYRTSTGHCAMCVGTSRWCRTDFKISLALRSIGRTLQFQNPNVNFCHQYKGHCLHRAQLHCWAHRTFLQGTAEHIGPHYRALLSAWEPEDGPGSATKLPHPCSCPLDSHQNWLSFFTWMVNILKSSSSYYKINVHMNQYWDLERTLALS